MVPANALQLTQSWKRATRLALLASVSVAIAGPVQAQDADPAEAADAEPIVVTGSRVVRDGFNAPSPTTILGNQALEARGAVNIGEALNDIPAFTPTTSTGTAGARPFAPGANYANLRSLGPTRTLVLVNGRRFAPSVPSFGTVGANQVDLT